MSDDKLGTVSVLGAAALWGLQGVLSKSVFAAGMGPLELATYKVGSAFIFLFAALVLFAPRHLKIKAKHLPALVVYGIIGVGIFNMAFLLAVNLATVTTAVTLLYTAPAFVSILSIIFLKEHFDRVKLYALLLTLTGCFLVVRGYTIDWSSLNLSGIGAGLAAGLSYALYSVLGKKNIQLYNRWTIMLYGLGTGTIMLSLISPPFVNASYSLLTWGNVLLLGIGTTLLAFILYIRGLSLLEASKASMIASLEPIVAVLLAVIILKETMEWPQILGFLLVMLAVYVLNRKLKAPPPAETNEK